MQRVVAELVVDERDVEPELPGEGRLERALLQLDHDVPELTDVEEEQIDVEVRPVDLEVHLPTDEGEAGAELCEMALWKRPFAAGDVMSVVTDAPPDDSPNTVTFAESPPNASMFSRTQVNAKI